MSRITRALLALVVAALAAPAGAGAAPALQPVGTFAAPMFVTAPPRDRTRLFVVERGGTIRVVRNGTTLAAPFLDISADVDTAGERGLLSMAFAADYEQSGLFYVYMVARDPVGEIQVREYRRSAGSAELADPTGRIVFRATHNEESNHNGGQIEWGPDGYLWFATGDGGGGDDVHNHARDLASPLGKMLRIDPRAGNAGSYTIPAGNPFGTAVWAYGLRNPFRFSFDRGSGGPGDRRRRPGPARGDRLGAGGERARARCRLRLGVQGGDARRAQDLHGERELPPAGVRVRQRGRHARGGGRLCRARSGAADAARALRLRRHLRRRRALDPPRTGRHRRSRRRARAARPDRLLRRGRLRARLRRLAQRHRRAHRRRAPGRLRAQARAAAAARAGPGAAARRRPTRGHRPHRAAGQHPRRPQGPRRPPRDAADRADGERALPRDDPRPAGQDEPQARAHAAARRAPHDRAAAPQGRRRSRRSTARCGGTSG